MFIQPPTVYFLQWQVVHYKKLVEQSTTEEQRIFRKKELYNIQMALAARLN